MKCWAKTARLVSLRRSGIFALFVLVLLGGIAFSQETTLRSQSNVVLIPALVKDPQGGIVYGLQAKNFLVEDDGVEQPARLDEATEGQPISLVVAIQRGGRASYEFPRMQGLKSMLDPLFALGTARVAVVEFDSQVEITRNFTRDATLVEDDLRNLQPGGGGAAILDAIGSSINLLKQEPEERLRILLLISETRDHGSIRDIDEVVTLIGNSNIAVYTLAFSPTTSNLLDDLRGKLEKKGESVDVVGAAIKLLVMARQAMRQNAPKEIARLTGGEYELFKSHRAFENHMVEFANHVHNRYLLSFVPKGPHPGLHEIRVRVKDAPSVTILARENYWAKPPE